MSLKFKGLKIIAICVLVAFATLALRVDLLAAPKAKPQPVVEKKVTSAAKFQDLLKDTEKLFEGMDADLGRKKDVTPKLAQLRQHRSDLQGQADNIRGEMAKTRAELIAKKLPAEIIQRHDAFAQHFEANVKALLVDLDEAEQAKPGQLQGRVKAARDYLNKNIHRERHIPLDPNKLPHRTPKIERKEPRLKKKDFERDFLKPQKTEEPREPILVAANGSLKGLLASHDEQDTGNMVVAQATNQPTADDLAETVEVQFTNELREIATLLDNNPVSMYEFVRNNFTYEPYYGSLKGSQSTLLLQQGNDFDQASLLIALLRVSGIPARYVYGTIEIPIEDLMNWIGGVTDPKLATQVFATGGIPVKGLIEGGQIKYAQLEHVWVEAYVPYGNYRGVLNDPTAPHAWIPLDPSFKTHIPNPEARDLADIQGFDIDNYLSTYLQTVKPKTPAQEYLKNTISYVDNNLPGQSFFDLLSEGSISDKILGLLPNTLPYPVEVIGKKFSSIPDTYRHRIGWELIDPTLNETVLHYAASWSTLLHKRFTLSYAPATVLDEQVIATYGGIYSTPPYLIYVKPILMVEGITVAEGGAINMAHDIISQMNFYKPNGVLVNEKINILTAGAPLAVGLGAGYTTGRIITYRASKLEAAVNSGKMGEPILGEYLNLIALNYLQALDSSRKMIAQTMKLLDTNRVAELMVGVDLEVSYIFGIPRSVDISGLFIDVDYSTSTAVDMAGDQTKVRRFQILSGMTSSALEHSAFEEIIGAEAVSAIKALQVTNVQGIPIHRIDSSNILTILPLLQLSSEIKTDIQNAVQAGKVVIVSERNIQLNNWNGVGYIILDPATGTGAYMLSGISGGHLTIVEIELKLLIATGRMTEKQAKDFISNNRKLIWFYAPVPGPVCSEWGWRYLVDPPSFHYGNDFCVPMGTAVYAVAMGEVIKAEADGKGDFGRVIEIDHGLGVVTRYSHNCEVLVKTGIMPGLEPIAKSGNTGKVFSRQYKKEEGGAYLPPAYPRCNEKDPKGAHLDFRVLLNGKEVNPRSFSMQFWY